VRRHTHLGTYALVTRQDEVLLVLKSRGPYTGSWDLPGGRIEFGESPESALARELEEETGYQMQGNPQLLGTGSHVLLWMPEPGMREELHHLGFLYQVTITDKTKLPVVFRNDEDVTSVEWKTREGLAELSLTPFAAQVLRGKILTES
jgi:8-oxo-dGTP pyrophosphatase MutT (NUDIX family)